MKNIHKLPLHNTLIIDNNTSVLKVPNGLIYTIKTIETITNIKDNSKYTITNTNTVYVPYTNNNNTDTITNTDNDTGSKPNPDIDLPDTQYTII